MIRLKINNHVSFDCPQGWHDVILKDYISLSKCKDVIDMIQMLTGLSIDILQYVDLESIAEYMKPLTLNVTENIEASRFIFLNEKKDDFFELPEDIGEKSWLAKIRATQLFNEKKEIEAMCIYLMDEVDEKKIPLIIDRMMSLPCTEVFAGIMYIAEKLNEFSKLEKKVLKSVVDDKQRRAGIDMFDQLGDFNTIDLIAGGDVLKYDAVLRIDYNTIFNKLRKINLTAIFEKNYSELK